MGSLIYELPTHESAQKIVVINSRQLSLIGDEPSRANFVAANSMRTSDRSWVCVKSVYLKAIRETIYKICN